MKTVSIIVVGVCLLISVECYLDQNGVCTESEQTCSKDCSAVALCGQPGFMPLLHYCYGETPHCNNGQCTSAYNPNCNQAYNPTFYCPTRDGTYPDPYDCTRFHICLNRRPYSSYCGRPGLVFSTRTLSCVRESYENPCMKFSCKSHAGWQSYRIDARYAIQCTDSVNQLVEVGQVVRCLDGFVFNVSTQICEFRCPKEGLFPRYGSYSPYKRASNDSADLWTTDNTTYVECSLLYGREYQMTIRECPNDGVNNSTFNAILSECELDDTQRWPVIRTTEYPELPWMLNRTYDV